MCVDCQPRRNSTGYGCFRCGGKGCPECWDRPSMSGPGPRHSSGDMEYILRAMDDMRRQLEWITRNTTPVITSNSTNKKMSKVGNMMQRLLDADTQKMVKAGFINGDLELTDNGKKVLWAIIFSANKAEFVKEADAAIEEAAEAAK